MATERAKRERPEKPRQSWVNSVASKYFDLVPPEERSSVDELFVATDQFWKAKDMSAKGTARALCMGAKGKKGAAACSKPFDKSLRVASRPEHKRDAFAFFDELDVPRPASLRKLAGLAPDSAAADLVRRIEAAQGTGLPPVKVKAPKEPKPEREKKAARPPKEKKPPREKKPPKPAILPGEDRIMITVENTATGETACASLARIIRSATGTPADVADGVTQLRALQPGQSLVLGNQRYTLDCPTQAKKPKGPKADKLPKEKRVKEPPAPKEKKVKPKKEPKPKGITSEAEAVLAGRKAAALALQEFKDKNLDQSDVYEWSYGDASGDWDEAYMKGDSDVSYDGPREFSAPFWRAFQAEAKAGARAYYDRTYGKPQKERPAKAAKQKPAPSPPGSEVTEERDARAAAALATAFGLDD